MNVMLSVTCIVLCTMLSCQESGVLPDEPYQEEEPETQATEETEVKTYKDITKYHWPEELKGKKIVNAETGTGYSFSEDGLYQPTSMLLYPNPVMPDMFNSAIDGKTREEVSEYDTGFTYGLYMQGKFVHKGREYFGEIKVEVRRDGEDWFIGEKAAVVM